MTDAHPTPDTGATHEAHGAPVGHGAPAGHATAAHDDHGETPLGPVDAQAWGAGILGVAVGALVAILLYAVSYH
ncbi:MAG TPA: hypothetical protein VID25_09405 [Candidatus Limnocylindrales bacterium]